jgi:hypothetical protein
MSIENQKQIEAYQDLFNYLYNKGLVLIQSEMDDIIDLSTKAIDKYNKQEKDYDKLFFEATGKIPIDGDCYACVDGETVIFYRGNWLERKI